MARLRNNSLDYNSAKAMTAISKDADMSPFNACSKLFESHRMGNTANPPRCAHLVAIGGMAWICSCLYAVNARTPPGCCRIA